MLSGDRVYGPKSRDYPPSTVSDAAPLLSAAANPVRDKKQTTYSFPSLSASRLSLSSLKHSAMLLPKS